MIPDELTLTRVVVPVWRSCTNTSVEPLVSPGTRLSAQLQNATKRPSGLTDGETLSLNGTVWRVVHAPGHSPGGVLFVHDASNQAIVGDTLFMGGIGRHDFPTSNAQDLRRTISEVLMSMPDEMVIHPGHGPSTTIGKERRTNPFVVQGF